MISIRDRSRFQFSGSIGFLECNRGSDQSEVELVYSLLSSCSVFLEKPVYLSLLEADRIAMVVSIREDGTPVMIMVSHVEEGNYCNLFLGISREIGRFQEPIVVQAIRKSLEMVGRKSAGRILQWFVPESYWHYLEAATPLEMVRQVGVFSELKSPVDALSFEPVSKAGFDALKGIQFVSDADLFALYEQTCKDSMDCPEGGKLRNPQSTFQGLMSDPGLEKGLSVVFFEGEEPVAFLLGSLEGDSARVLYVGVNPGHRKHGLARQLLDWFGGQLLKKNIRYLEVLVDEGNTPAWKLYMGIGLQVLHRWKLLMGR